MLVTNARKVLAKAGTLRESGQFLNVVIDGRWLVSATINGCDGPDAEIATVYARRLSDRDEIQSDYFAGCFFPSIAAAVRYARKEAADDAAGENRVRGPLPMPTEAQVAAQIA